jgi:hypothetical protein
MLFHVNISGHASLDRPPNEITGSNSIQLCSSAIFCNTPVKEKTLQPTNLLFKKSRKSYYMCVKQFTKPPTIRKDQGLNYATAKATSFVLHELTC